MLEEHVGRALDASRWVCEESTVDTSRCDDGTREQHHVIRLNRMTRGGHPPLQTIISPFFQRSELRTNYMQAFSPFLTL